MTNFTLLNRVELLVHNAPWRAELEFLLVSKSPGSEGVARTAYVSNVEFTAVDPNEPLVPGPTFRLGTMEAQSLMDELWRCGLRPSEGSGSAGALRAVERHLDDMRTLVGKSLDVQLKKEERGRG